MEHDLLIVLGGPIGIYDTALYPWLADELGFIGDRVRASMATIGVCLGAQAIAASMGARVFASGHKEIGFAPISLTAAGEASCLAPFARQPLALHWHGDTFDLPAGAALLASTPQTPHQAFGLGRSVLGVQFHPEAGGPGFERWLIGHSAELASANIEINALRDAAICHQAALVATAEAVMLRFLAHMQEGVTP